MPDGEDPLTDPFDALRPPPGPPLDAAEPARARRRWPLIALGLALLAGGAGVAAWVLLRGADPHPSEWDERLLPLVRFVEDERGLTFDHPVHVDFLDDDEWEANAEIDRDELLEEDLALIEHGEGLFRAVGLAEGDLDLLGDVEELSASGTVGLYRFDDERILVRGTELTGEVKATLVHELTHVLQDQRFAIGERLGPDAEDDIGSMLALIEGDADRIEEAWVESLPAAERDELEAEEETTGGEAAEVLDELPSSLVTFFASDYILGAGLIQVLDASGGQRAIDEAFESPPGPEEHVLDPLSYVDDEQPRDVEAPDVDGEPIADLDGEFGAVSLFLVLAERTDPVAALDAVSGWNGDDYQAFVRDGRTCLALRVATDDATAATRLAEVAAEWVAAMPSEAGATTARDGEDVDIITCDPGPDTDLVEGTGRSEQVIVVPAVRAQLAVQVLDGGGNVEQARCFGHGVVTRLELDLLLAEDVSDADQAEIQRIAAEVAAGCR